MKKDEQVINKKKVVNTFLKYQSSLTRIQINTN